MIEARVTLGCFFHPIAYGSVQKQIGSLNCYYVKLNPENYISSKLMNVLTKATLNSEIIVMKLKWRPKIYNAHLDQ